MDPSVERRTPAVAPSAAAVQVGPAGPAALLAAAVRPGSAVGAAIAAAALQAGPTGRPPLLATEWGGWGPG